MGLGSLFYEAKDWLLLTFTTIATGVLILLGGLLHFLLPRYDHGHYDRDHSHDHSHYHNNSRDNRDGDRLQHYHSPRSRPVRSSTPHNNKKLPITTFDKQEEYDEAHTPSSFKGHVTEAYERPSVATRERSSRIRDPYRNIGQDRNNMSFEVGCKVCTIVSLYVFAITNLFLLYLLFFHLNLNSPYRVDFELQDLQSTRAYRSSLANGVQYSVAHTDYKRDKFSIVLRVGVGSHEEKEEQQIGLAALAEHLSLDSGEDSDNELYGGSTGKRNHIDKELRKLGANLRSFTSLRSTVFAAFDIPYSDPHMRRVLNLFKILTLAQNATDESLQVARGIIKGEERVFNTTKEIITQQVLCNHFGKQNHICTRLPYSSSFHNQIYGEHITAQDVNQFYNEWYIPERISIYIAGDFITHDVVRQIESIWGDARRTIYFTSQTDEGNQETLSDFDTNTKNNNNKINLTQKEANK